ncbi:guanylate-binding protein 1-like [Anomaloglossus baeobatrachus]|uniref:guanylate-binding protein 1-like n=1 Tax=Anomaloglossus baeobatrachus TaxID=238106 RepID=UPI003F500E65
MAAIQKISQPICLVENPEDKTLFINEEAKKVLENILQPLVVVSIVGPYRSGKSYLLNKLSGNSEGGFSLGHTLSANTKGIWMRCVPHPQRSGHTLVLLDTEGIGDVGKANQQNDRKILSLAMLMSSVVIYNSKNAIDQNAVDKLYSMTETHRIIADKASKQDGHDAQTDSEDHMRPHLVWTLRDATLKLEIDRQPVSADEYLENSLQEIARVKSIMAQDRNRARKTIKNFFPKRKCFVFDFPSSDKEVLSTIDQISETKLQPEFVEQTTKFCQFILDEVPEKRLKGGIALTGSRFANLLQSYINVVTRPDSVFLESSISDLFTHENRKVTKDSIKVYEDKMSSQHMNSQEEFEQIHEAAVDQATQEFKKLYVRHEKSLEEYLHDLKADLLKKKDETWKMCEETSVQRCNEILTQIKSKLVQNLEENKYHVLGGHQTFIKDKKVIIEEYNQQEDKGVKAKDILQDFLNFLEPIEQGVLKNDQNMSAAKSKIFKVTDPNNTKQLTQYIQGYQLPQGPFNRVLIQLFGFAGHGKSSFVNSSLFTLSSDGFHDYAGEATSDGGKTMDRRGYKLTNAITIVDNRGLSKMDSAQEWEVYAQLCNCVPLNEVVSWDRTQDDRFQLVTKRIAEGSSDVIVPVLVYSSQKNLVGEDHKSISEFLKQAQKLTGILPFVILTKSKSLLEESPLKDTFFGMGMESVHCLENYVLSDKLSVLSKHRRILKILYEILECVTFHMSNVSNFQSQRQQWLTFLVQKAGTMQ